jgi:hypothetical protein
MVNRLSVLLFVNVLSIAQVSLAASISVPLANQKGVTWHWQSWQQKDGTVNWNGVAVDLHAMHQAGVTWARMHLGPEMSADLTDRLVSMAAAEDIHFLALVADTDAIAAKESPEWLAAMAHKYDGRIGVWEIGNEQNNSQYWSLQGGRSASVKRYVDYLRSAYATIKHSTPGATVLMGGLMGYHVEQFLPEFIRLGGGEFTDGFNIHPYASNPDGVVSRLSEIEHEISSDAYLQNKPVWITEIGYYANEPTWNNAGRVADEATKASYLTETISALRKHGVATPIFWYNFHDSEPGVCGYSLILYVPSGREVALPAYRAYRDLSPHGTGRNPLQEISSPHQSACP